MKDNKTHLPIELVYLHSILWLNKEMMIPNSQATDGRPKYANKIHFAHEYFACLVNMRIRCILM